MLTAQMLEAMNSHLNKELYSSYLYLAMAAYCEARNLPGCAHWLEAQAEEERGHAMKFYRFIADRGGRVTLQAIAEPPADFASPLALFEQVLEHERVVTRAIESLYSSAAELQDYASQIFLQWFISEQVEEEKSASEVVETLRSIGDSSVGLIMLDKELGRR